MIWRCCANVTVTFLYIAAKNMHSVVIIGHFKILWIIKKNICLHFRKNISFFPINWLKFTTLRVCCVKLWVLHLRSFALVWTKRQMGWMKMQIHSLTVGGSYRFSGNTAVTQLSLYLWLPLYTEQCCTAFCSFKIKKHKTVAMFLHVNRD